MRQERRENSNGERVPSQTQLPFHQMQMSALSHEMSSQRKYELFFLRVHRDAERDKNIPKDICPEHEVLDTFRICTTPAKLASLESQIPRWHWQHLQARRGKSGAGAPPGTALLHLPTSRPHGSCASTAMVKSLGERGKKLLRCLRKDNARSRPRAMWGPENSCPNRRQKQHQRGLHLLNTETPPLRSARVHLVSGNIPRDSSTMSSKKSWLNKPRDLLKLAQHSEHPGTWRFSLSSSEKKDLNSPSRRSDSLQGWLISVTKNIIDGQETKFGVHWLNSVLSLQGFNFWSGN